MTKNPPPLLDIVGYLYEAASDVSRWEQFLRESCRYFDAHGANLLHLDSDNAELSVSLVVGFEHRSLEDQRQATRKQAELQGEDPRIAYSMVHQNKPFRCTDVMPAAEFHATRIYRELLQPCGIEYSLMVQYSDTPGIFTGLAYLRSPRDQAFSEGDAERLGELVPHLRRALAIQRRMIRVDHQLQASYQVLETLPTGVAIADWSGRIEFANGAAREIFELHDGIVLREQQLRLATQDVRDELLATMHRVAAGGEHAALTLPRPSGRPGFQCLITQLKPSQNRELPNLLSRPRVALYISNPEQPIETQEQLLQRMFGLTLAEAKVVERLVAGRTPEEVAEDNKVGITTVRSQLKSVFSKTGTSRQSELVQKVLTSPIWLARSCAAQRPTGR